jgi:hypothetical protein
VVRGLDVFRKRFAGFEDRYVLIGGAAVDIAMDAAALEFRVTKDLDIVLHVEALDADFVRAFWAFIEDGGYELRERSTGKPIFYRFHSPTDASYPFMLELFAIAPELIVPPTDARLTPLPVSDEASSLSAILLDDDYYDFLRQGMAVRDGISVLTPSHIVPLKAHAWLDLTSRRDAGVQISSKDIKKHRNDVIRLSQLIAAAERVQLPAVIHDHLTTFSERALSEGADPGAFGIRGVALADVRSLLEAVYERIE